MTEEQKSFFNVRVYNEEDKKFVPILEHALTDTYKKLLGARLIYGDKLIDYLTETKQFDNLMDAINGKLNKGSVMMVEDVYERIFG